MSFFTHPFYTQGSSDPSFAPLFRLLDDFDSYSRQTPSRGGHRSSTHVRHFTPRFDIRETENTFELHGELPGIDKEHITVDFTDPQTILIKGKIERTYQAGSPPVEWNKSAGAITESGEQQQSHKATVEDAGEEGDGRSTTATNEGATPTASTTSVAKKTDQKPADQARYWVSERSIGEFSRSFSFPVMVDQDAVKASLKDGILHITVPKAKKPTARRINVL